MHIHERAVALNHHQRRFLSILRPRASSDDAPSRSLSASSRRAPLRLQISSTRPASRGRLPRRHRQRPERARRFRRREHRISRPRLARRTLRAPSPRRAPSRARLSVCPVQRARPPECPNFCRRAGDCEWRDETSDDRARSATDDEETRRRVVTFLGASTGDRSSTRARRPVERRGEIDANADVGDQRTG